MRSAGNVCRVTTREEVSTPKQTPILEPVQVKKRDPTQAVSAQHTALPTRLKLPGMHPSWHLPGRSRPTVPMCSPAAAADAATPGRPARLRRLPGLRARAVGLALALSAGGVSGLWGLGALPWSVQQASPVTGCDVLRQSCIARFPDGTTLALQLVPQGASASSALGVAMQAGGFAPRSVGLDLDGETMAMGPNHLDLQLGGDGRWRGQAALSACLSGRMAWVATLRARAGLGERVARFQFVSGDPAR